MIHEIIAASAEVNRHNDRHIGGDGRRESQADEDLQVFDAAETDLSETALRQLASGVSCPKMQYWRGKLEAFLDQPESSDAAMWFAIVSLLVIVFNSVASVVHTLPVFVDSDPYTWNLIETCCVCWFTVEFLVRLSVTSRVGRFVLDPLNIIDVLAIVPFYVDLFVGQVAGSGLTILRMIRLMRSMRMLKMSRYSGKVQLLGRAMRQSMAELLILMCILCIVTVVASSVLFFTASGYYHEEEGQWVLDGAPSEFSSIPSGFYWSIVTLATVGYGDHAEGTDPPFSEEAKVCACLLAFAGIIMISMPISVVGMNFNKEWKKLEQQSTHMVSDITMRKEDVDSEEFLDCFEPLAAFLEEPGVRDRSESDAQVLGLLLKAIQTANDKLMVKSRLVREQQEQLQKLTSELSNHVANVTFVLMIKELSMDNTELSRTGHMEHAITKALKRLKAKVNMEKAFRTDKMRKLFKKSISQKDVVGGIVEIRPAAEMFGTLEGFVRKHSSAESLQPTAEEQSEGQVS